MKNLMGETEMLSACTPGPGVKVPKLVAIVGDAKGKHWARFTLGSAPVTSKDPLYKDIVYVVKREHFFPISKDLKQKLLGLKWTKLVNKDIVEKNVETHYQHHN